MVMAALNSCDSVAGIVQGKNAVSMAAQAAGAACSYSAGGALACAALRVCAVHGGCRLSDVWAVPYKASSMLQELMKRQP